MTEPASSSHRQTPAGQEFRTGITRRRLVLAVLGVAGGGIGLTACSTGNSREAERGQRRDAERTSVVDEVQATRTAGLILGTPPPATPSTPAE